MALAGVLVLADLATAWTLLVLPLFVAALVKAHDLLAGLLGGPAAPQPEPADVRAAPAPAAVRRAADIRPPDARTAPAPAGAAPSVAEPRRRKRPGG